MGNKRTSIIWLESKEDFEKRVKNATSIANIVRSYNYAITRTAYKTINQRIAEDNINIDHIKLGPQSNKGRIFLQTRVSIDKYLINGSKICSSELKRKLIRDNYLKNECYECGLKNLWNNKPISLHLDHINGVRNDNRLDNLRLLCPNCHSQTSTYSGKQNGKKCIDCGKKINSKSNRCLQCAGKTTLKTNKKFEITKEELEKLVWSKPTVLIAKEFNVSDKAVEKRCKKFGIIKPSRGYWSNKHGGII